MLFFVDEWSLMKMNSLKRLKCNLRTWIGNIKKKTTSKCTHQLLFCQQRGFAKATQNERQMKVALITDIWVVQFVATDDGHRGLVTMKTCLAEDVIDPGNEGTKVMGSVRMCQELWADLIFLSRAHLTSFSSHDVTWQARKYFNKKSISWDNES